MATVFDLIVLGLVAGMTYALMSEGLWGACLMFFNALFAALISFNFYEPLAELIVTNASFAMNFADSLSMMALFIASLLGLRLATEAIAPSMVRFPTPVYQVGRLIFAVGGALVTIAMFLLALQASPVQKHLVGVMGYDYKPFYTERFDRDFLAFFQYTTGYTFARNGAGAADVEFPQKPMLFDPKAEWLLFHQLYRPYGDEPIIPDTSGEAAAPAGGAPAGGAAPGGAPGGGARAGGPNSESPRIPGGTAGAAIGLAPTGP